MRGGQKVGVSRKEEGMRRGAGAEGVEGSQSTGRTGSPTCLWLGNRANLACPTVRLILVRTPNKAVTFSKALFCPLDHETDATISFCSAQED